jgi:hypothetical protein
MANAATLPSDLFRPELALEYFGFEFSDSLALLDGMMGPGEDMPVQLLGLENVQGRAAYVQQPIFKEIGILVQDRTITSINDVDTLKLEGRNDLGVMRHKRIGPVAISADAGFLTKASQGDLEAEFARQAAFKTKVAIQTSAIAAIYGILQAITASAHTLDVHNDSIKTNFTPGLMTRGLQKMGEFDERINSWLMRSETLQDLRDDNIGRAFAGVADQVLKSGTPLTLGRRFGIVDSSYLTSAVSSGLGYDKYRTIGLGSKLLKISIDRIKFYPAVMYVNKDTVQFQFRGDVDYTILPTGMAWDVANGGSNPTDDGLATANNWDATYSSHKEVHGILVQHTYSQN